MPDEDSGLGIGTEYEEAHHRAGNERTGVHVTTIASDDESHSKAMGESQPCQADPQGLHRKTMQLAHRCAEWIWRSHDVCSRVLPAAEVPSFAQHLSCFLPFKAT